jgi:hypothetical protein
MQTRGHKLKKDIEAFIVRVWQEAENIKGNGAVWRGSIVHVGSNRQLYFYNLESIARFIKEHTQEQAQEYPDSSHPYLNSFRPTLFNRIYEHIHNLGTRIWYWRQQ